MTSCLLDKTQIENDAGEALRMHVTILVECVCRKCEIAAEEPVLRQETATTTGARQGASSPLDAAREDGEDPASATRRPAACSAQTLGATDYHCCGVLHKMMNIWQLKAKEEARKKSATTSPAQLRAQKDVSELDLPPTMRTVFPDTNDLMHFNLFITPDEGIYKDATFGFTFTISNNYPHQAPKVKCVNKIYHPNVDLDGNVCLNILREDWNPVLNLNGVMVGLQFLFLEPNADDPLNKDAAEALRRDRKQFARDARACLSGRPLRGETYDKLL